MSSIVNTLHASRRVNFWDSLASVEKGARFYGMPQCHLRNNNFHSYVALVEKIYRAQKERDAAVLLRLRLANEERDEVLTRMKRLEQEQQGLVKRMYHINEN